MLRRGKGRKKERFKVDMAQAEKMKEYCEEKVDLQPASNLEFHSEMACLCLKSQIRRVKPLMGSARNDYVVSLESCLTCRHGFLTCGMNIYWQEVTRFPQCLTWMRCVLASTSKLSAPVQSCCRRQTLLKHFGESYDRRACQSGINPCDTCR